MEEIACIICGSGLNKKLFTKSSKDGEPFTLKKCSSCNLEFISPQPGIDEIQKYYSKEYFTKRTERGYNNYFSDEIKNEIERVIKLNLMDMSFFEFEKNLKTKTSLDIGCAAGYFVNYLQNRGWDSCGIDISEECVSFAKNNGLNVERGDYLTFSFKEKFDLITMWASIEHLHNPQKFIEKIYEDMTEQGLLLLSTCRSGFLNFKNLFGPDWRYYNFPEHLFFFSYKSIKKLLELNGFKIINYSTYGSGAGKGGSLVRKFSDWSAKRFYLGDMMLIGAVKESEE